MTEQRLINVKPLMTSGWHLVQTGESNTYIQSMSLADVPVVDAVSISRLGELGRLLIPYKGCPRGRLGEQVYNHLTKLDPIEDVDGNRWITVLEDDLSYIEVTYEIAHGKWYKAPGHPYRCSNCGEIALLDMYGESHYRSNYCPNCGAKMDGEAQ